MLRYNRYYHMLKFFRIYFVYHFVQDICIMSCSTEQYAMPVIVNDHGCFDIARKNNYGCSIGWKYFIKNQ